MHLGLSDDEFFALTPRQFAALIKAKKEQLERNEALVGILAATIGNHSMNPPKKAYVPADFMPSQSMNRAPVKKRINRKATADSIRSFLMAQMEGRQ